MNAPHTIETARLVLRRPRSVDVRSIFERYAGDPEVTEYVGWPVHRSLDDTRGFLMFSDGDWARWPAGPYLVESRADGRLLGGTGLGFETMQRASTGYVFARDAWGFGFATEALAAMVTLARDLNVRRLYAVCHVDHRASARVLEKCDFACEGTLRQYAAFPNLGSGAVCDVRCYARILGD